MGKHLSNGQEGKSALLHLIRSVYGNINPLYFRDSVCDNLSLTSPNATPQVMFLRMLIAPEREKWSIKSFDGGIIPHILLKIFT